MGVGRQQAKHDTAIVQLTCQKPFFEASKVGFPDTSKYTKWRCQVFATSIDFCTRELSRLENRHFATIDFHKTSISLCTRRQCGRENGDFATIFLPLN